MARRFEVALPDGRVLEALEEGDPEGTLLVYHHGSPGAAVPYGPFDRLASERGVRFASYSRPGFAGSSRHEGRTVADAAGDAAALADHLGADRFLTLGWSGGGPHALACAALLPERAMACATIASIAPWGAEGLDWTAGMGETNQVEYPLAARDPDKLLEWIEEGSEWFASAQAADLLGGMRSVVSDADRPFLDGELGEMVAATYREGYRIGIWGHYDDDLAFTRPWGFELSSTRAPVSVWQGEQDLFVPFAHGRWLTDHVAGARAHLFPEEGHLSIGVGKLDAIVDDLLAAAGLTGGPARR